MTVTKILIEKDFDDNIFEIKGENFFYLSRVLRHKVGDIFFVTGKKNYYLAKIIAIQKDKIVAQVEEKRQIKNVNLKIHLFFGLLKGEKNDLVIKGGTQYSVASFHPIIMKRTIVRLSPEEKTKKVERLRRLAKDFARESFLGFIPEVHDIEDLSKQEFPAGLKLLFYEGENMKNLTYFAEEIKNSSIISLFFGPEGGIDKEEYDFLIKKGFEPVTLGERMIKAEFAIFAGINFISYLKEGKIL